MKKRTPEEIRAEIAQVEAEERAALDAGRMRSIDRLRGRKQALGHELERAMAQEAAMGATTSTQMPATAPKTAQSGQRTTATAGAATARRQRGQVPGGARKDRRLAAVAGVAIAVAVVTVGFSGWRWTQAQGELTRLEQSTVKVVTVTRDVAPGEVIASADLTVASVPKAFAPKDAAKKVSDVAGRQSVTQQTSGTAVSLSSVSGSKKPASITTAVTEGRVAYTVALDSSTGLSPLLAVGDKVDVTGISKGHGYEGPVKRCGGHRTPMTHGGGPVHRQAGSMGPTSSPSRIFKGHHGAGQMGVEQVTVENLDIVKVDDELNMIVVRGAIPGPKGGVVYIKNTVKNFKAKGAAANASINPQKASARTNPQKASARNR